VIVTFSLRVSANASQFADSSLEAQLGNEQSRVRQINVKTISGSAPNHFHCTAVGQTKIGATVLPLQRATAAVKTGKLRKFMSTVHILPSYV
jgi:hypothetical protein